MKKSFKKTGCLLLTAALFVAMAIPAFADSAKTMKVTLRVEGIQSNLFYKTEEVPYTDSLTLQSALKYIDTKEDSIKITGIDTNFISDINGEASAKFGGWDGWLFKVNDQDAAVGIDSYTLKDGDSVLLYYGDPYGVGMQFPVADTSKLSEGILKFASSDTTFNADGSSTVKVNPVAGATVTWNYGDQNVLYTTDENGEIKIDAAQLTEGAHGVQIEKVSDAGIPLVLRFAPDYAITVSSSDGTQTSTTTNLQTTSATVSQTTAQTTAAVSDTVSPKTGYDYGDSVATAVILSASAVGFLIATAKGRKQSHEK